MAEEEKFKVNKTGAKRDPFWKVFYYDSEQMISVNYSQDMLKDPIEKKSSLVSWT